MSQQVPPFVALQPPRPSAGLARGFSRGALFGLLTGLLPALQVGIGVIAVLLNQDSLAQWQLCLPAGHANDPGCSSAYVVANAISESAQGACCLVWLVLPLGIYVLAGRSGAKATNQTITGIVAAIVAAAIGSFTALAANVAAAAFQLNPLFVFEDRGSFGGRRDSDIFFTILIGLVGSAFAVGAAALMGWVGARSAVRRYAVPGYGAVPPVPYPGPPPPYGAPFTPPGAPPPGPSGAEAPKPPQG